MIPGQDRERVCPSPVDRRLTLFSHRVSTAQSQERQRRGYHKCYTCEHRNNQHDPGSQRTARPVNPVPFGLKQETEG